MPASFGMPGRSCVSVIHCRCDRVLEQVEVPEELVVVGEAGAHLEVGADQLVLAIDPEGGSSGAGMTDAPERLEAAVEVFPFGGRRDAKAISPRSVCRFE